ncbi:TonB-dependent siderophore receptor [Bordetella sp. BOR01]|uniref:TonB-dependent siderophore receptor n=1 Tax=Bordetella sp. BOR01 TaxID=2854779 RepID=UPI001C4545F9|nr:TonB-dependent siderophore receptor [Bordetella sp. BOR01]MBV7483119.1 TonB-dependent siderophore receptor [Bordetella sp. BOR01]
MHRCPEHALRPLSAAIRMAAAVAIMASSWIAPGQASAAQESAADAAPSAQRSYDIPAGPLRTVLTRFASEAGIYLAGSIELANGKSSPGLQGSYTAAQGLGRVLDGTGLQAVPDANRRYVLKPLPAASVSELPTVTVTGQTEFATGPVVGYMAQRSATATKTDTPIVETPQSISVVTANQIRDTASNTLDQALTYSAGVRTSIYGASSRMDTAQARGVEIEDIFLDGLKDRVNFWTSTPRVEPYLMERMEVLRGPASMLYGQGGTGGLINNVSKLPQAEAQHEVGVQVGNHDLRQLQADLTGPLTEDGTWLYRLVALGRESGTQVDYGQDDRQMIAPSLTWAPSADTELTLRLKWQKDRASGDSGSTLPWEGTILPNPNGRISRHTFVGQPGYDHFNADSLQAGWSFRQNLNDQWTFRQSTRWTKNKTDYAAFDVFAPYLDAEQRMLDRAGYFWKHDTTILAADQNLLGKFSTGQVEHQLLVGLDFLRYRDSGSGVDDYTGLAPIDVFNPVYQEGYQPPPREPIATSGVKQLGVYIQDEMRWRNWILLAGWRHDEAKNWEEGTDDRNDRADSARVGLMYEIVPGLLPYISYAESFLPQANTSYGQQLKPLRGKQWEAGVKYEPPAQDWRASAAVFELREVNRTVEISETQVAQRGQTRNTGLELEWVGSITPRMDINASFTYLNVDRQLTGVPKRQAALWSTYRFSLGNLDGFTVGAGVHYASGFVDESTEGLDVPKTPSVTLLDAMLAWENRNWRVALNASNLTDKAYFTQCSEWGSCSYGTGRLVTLTTSYRW